MTAERPTVTVIGAGLAGCEAAWQLGRQGIAVRLLDMKPKQRTPAQVSDAACELVCSNSLRSASPLNAVGLIKEEMARLDSLVIAAAYEARVPAGDALAVDRERFAAAVSARLASLPHIERVCAVVEQLPDADAGPVIVATGPLTAPALADDLGRLSGKDRLYFYDAIAPIIAGDSIDRDVVFAASRYGKGGGDDYLNCPMDPAQYDTFLDALLAAECMPLHDFESPKFFEGCLPVEVIAGRGRDALRFGCMKPVGLDDPRTGRWPHAVVQLRQEDPDGQAFNLVGFQTKLKHPEQKRVLRLIPGLEKAEFLRLGAVHRNTYVDSPKVLDENMRLRARPNVRLAGQITGVEGYVESAAHGLMTARLLAAELSGTTLVPPPRTTALGALFAHVTGEGRLPGRPHEPQNVNWGMFPALPRAARTRGPGRKRNPKEEGKRARVLRAMSELELWASTNAVTLAPASVSSAMVDAALERATGT